MLVSGVGPIGALVLLATKAAGARRFSVSELNPNRRALAKTLVPEAIVFDPRETDTEALFRSHTEEGVGVDVALECVGAEASLNLCAKAVRRQGTVVQVGLHVRPAAIDAMLWALKDITVEATWCYPVQIWPRIAQMIRRRSSGRKDRHGADRPGGRGRRRLRRPDRSGRVHMKILVNMKA